MDNEKDVAENTEQHNKEVFAPTIPVDSNLTQTPTFSKTATDGELSDSSSLESGQSTLTINNVQPEAHSNSTTVTNSSRNLNLLPKIKIVTSCGKNKQNVIKIVSSKNSTSKIVVLPKLGEQFKVINATSSQVIPVKSSIAGPVVETTHGSALSCETISLAADGEIGNGASSKNTIPIKASPSIMTSSAVINTNLAPSLVSSTVNSTREKINIIATDNTGSRKIIILKPPLNVKPTFSSGQGKVTAPGPILSQLPQIGKVTSIASTVKIIGLPTLRVAEGEKTSISSPNQDQLAQAASSNETSTKATTPSSAPVLHANTAIRPTSVAAVSPTGSASKLVRISPTSLLKPRGQPNSEASSTSGSSTAKSKAACKPVQSNLCLVVPTGASAVVDATLESSCKILATVKHPGRKSAYGDILKLLMEKHEESGLVDKLKVKVLPIALYDIKNLTSDVDMDGALEFLGNFLQVCKLEPVMEDSVIKTLTLKILKTTSKLESKKAMWCLAHVDYRDNMPNELLITMLSSALLYVNECPPIPSLGTVCEGLNVVQHMYKKSPTFILGELEDILKGVFPLLFHETSRVRELALSLLQPIAPTICERKLLGETFQEKYRSIYHSRMLFLIGNESSEGLMLWRFLIESFGDALHVNNQLINDLLKLEELALKSNNFEFRLCALQSWRWLISCFARNQALMTQKKRLKLLMVPFTSSESKTAALARTKIELWWHVLESLGTKAVDFSGEVTLICLNFCFGGRNHPRGAVDAYPSLIPIATASLIGILSPAEPFNQWEFKRSVQFINSTGFIRHREEILYVCERALMNLEENTDLFEALVSTFLERCSHVDSDVSLVAQQVENLTGYLIELPESKPNLSRAALSCFLNSLDSPLFFRSFLKKIKNFFKWPCSFDTQFPTDIYEEVVCKCFEIGTRVPSESVSFVEEIAVCFESVKNVLPSNIFKITLARQWSQLVSMVLRKFTNETLVKIDQILFLFPMSIINEMRSGCDELWSAWSSYLGRLYQQDPSILKRIHNKAVDLFTSRGNEVQLMQTILKFAIQVLASLECTWPVLLDDWIATWVKSWNNYYFFSRGASKRNATMIDIMCDFLSFLLESVNDNMQLKIAHMITSQIRLAADTSEKYNDIRATIEKLVLQRTGQGCTHFFEENCASKTVAIADDASAPIVSGEPTETVPSPSPLPGELDREFSKSSPSPKPMDIQDAEVSEAEHIEDTPGQVENDTSFEVEEKFCIGSVADFGLVDDHISESPSDMMSENQMGERSPSAEPGSCIRIVEVMGAASPLTSPANPKTRKRKASIESDMCDDEDISNAVEEGQTEIRRSSRPPKPSKWRKLASELQSDEESDVFNYQWLYRKQHPAPKAPSPKSVREAKKIHTHLQVNNGALFSIVHQLNPSTLELINGDLKLRCQVKVLLHRIDN